MQKWDFPRASGAGFGVAWTSVLQVVITPNSSRAESGAKKPRLSSPSENGDRLACRILRYKEGLKISLEREVHKKFSCIWVSILFGGGLLFFSGRAPFNGTGPFLSVYYFCRSYTKCVARGNTLFFSICLVYIYGMTKVPYTESSSKSSGTEESSCLFCMNFLKWYKSNLPSSLLWWCIFVL